MVLAIFRRLFKSRKYDVRGDAEASVIFEKEPTTAPKLLKATPLSPILWRYIVTRSPAHAIDADAASTHSCAQSTTSSRGYGSQQSDDSYPMLGATSLGIGSPVTVMEDSSPAPCRNSAADRLAPSIMESSPEPEVRNITPNIRNNLIPPATLPPKTPQRAHYEIRTKMYPVLDLEEPAPEEESSTTAESEYISFDEIDYSPAIDPVTPATLPPNTPHRTCFARNEVRQRPALEMETSAESVCIWGDPDYSPESNKDIEPDSPVSAFARFSAEMGLARHESRKISLRRRATKTVSGRVRQMVKFFENDTIRHEIPRRLGQVSPNFMRSCPQIHHTPALPHSTRKHSTHSDLIRGVSNSSDRCIRCHSLYSTPNSRRSMM